MNNFVRQELEQAGFPPDTRELAFSAPVEELAGAAAEFDLEVRVDGVDGEARMSVGYLPGGPVTSGQQLIRNGETRLLRKQLAKPGSFLVVVLDQPGHVDVSLAGAHCLDEEGVQEALAGEDQYEDGEVFGADDKVVQAIGAAAADVADRIAVMNGVLQRLDALHARAKKERSFSFLLATGKSSDQALAAVQSNMDYLHGKGFAGVVAGQVPLTAANGNSWLGLANDTGHSLQEILGDLDQWDLSGTVADAAPRVAQTMKEAAEGGMSALHWVVVGLGLYLAIKVLS